MVNAVPSASELSTTALPPRDSAALPTKDSPVPHPSTPSPLLRLRYPKMRSRCSSGIGGPKLRAESDSLPRRSRAASRTETGVAMTQAQIDNHAAFLRHWVGAVAADPMAIFSAAKDADLMAGRMLGLSLKRTSLDAYKGWIGEHDQAIATDAWWWMGPA